MRKANYGYMLSVLTVVSLWAQENATTNRQYHQAPDQDGIYYVGPEVTAPRITRTVSVPYPEVSTRKTLQGITVLAMVVNEKGLAEHIQLLHTHGEAFDRAAVAAVKLTTFEPAKLRGAAVPVWIDIRVVFRASRSQAVPEVLITERDLAPPDEAQSQDKHHHPLPYTAPVPIHIVDAALADPFSRHPYVQVAIVAVVVDEEGLPKEVRVVRGLGFGLDEKAAAAVWHYRFMPATKKGRPIVAGRNVMVSFAEF
jgi:TonB family protein